MIKLFSVYLIYLFKVNISIVCLHFCFLSSLWLINFYEFLIQIVESAPFFNFQVLIRSWIFPFYKSFFYMNFDYNFFCLTLQKISMLVFLLLISLMLRFFCVKSIQHHTVNPFKGL